MKILRQLKRILKQKRQEKVYAMTLSLYPNGKVATQLMRIS